MELIDKLAAVAPLNGEAMIGVGTVVEHGNNELIPFRIVVHSPKVVRPNGGSGCCHREDTRYQRAGDPFPSKRAHQHHGTGVVYSG